MRYAYLNADTRVIITDRHTPEDYVKFLEGKMLTFPDSGNNNAFAFAGRFGIFDLFIAPAAVNPNSALASQNKIYVKGFNLKVHNNEMTSNVAFTQQDVKEYKPENWG